MSKKVFVTRKIPEKGLKILREHFEVEIFSKERPITKEEIISYAKGVDGILPLLTDNIDAEIMDKTEIKAIANFAVGYDNIDIQAATVRKIPVSNTPGVLTDATADITWALLLGVSRRIVEADRFSREKKFFGWDSMLCLGGDFVNKTLGIVGFGRIGQAVAKRAKGFGMKIIYHSRTRKTKSEQELGATYVNFKELLKLSDYITIHAPYNKETHEMFKIEQFKRMRSSAYFINTARGRIVKESDLVRALKKGWIAGAGLDVYYNEPRIHPGLMKLKNTILLPHIGSASLETRTKMAIMAAENLRDALLNKIPKNIVNPQIYN